MSASLNNAPRKSHLRVSAAIPEQNHPQPEIFQMKSDEIKKLYYGFLVSVWVDQPNDNPLKLERVRSTSISALMAISPIITDAVKANGPLLSDIDHIALPPGHPEGYEMLFKWLDSTTKTGGYRNVQPEFDTPLFKYHHILEIAKQLKITPILENLGPRYDTMLLYKKNSKWNIQSEDICRTYREFPAGHALRLAIVKGVALAWYYNDLGGVKRKQIEKITWEIPQLWTDLNELWEGFEQDGI